MQTSEFFSPRQVEKLTGATARVLDVEEPRSAAELSQSEAANGTQTSQSRRPRLSMGIRVKQISNGSAFRPVISSSGDQLTQTSSNGEGPLYHPDTARGSSNVDTSDSTDTDVRDKKKRYRRKHGLDKSKSSSMHELNHDGNDPERGRLIKSLSQEALIESAEHLADTHREEKTEYIPSSHLSNYSDYSPTLEHKQSKDEHTVSKSRSKLIYVRSSESENDSFESNTNASQSDDLALSSQPLRTNDVSKFKSQSSHQLYRYDSDSDKALSDGRVLQRHNAAGRYMQRSVSRDESLTSNTNIGNKSNIKRPAPLPTAISETYLSSVCFWFFCLLIFQNLKRKEFKLRLWSFWEEWHLFSCNFKIISVIPDKTSILFSGWIHFRESHRRRPTQRKTGWVSERSRQGAHVQGSCYLLCRRDGI